MKTNYNPIADGTYICERRHILKDLGSWSKMTDDEKQFFKPCHRCKPYNQYINNDEVGVCPCETCHHRKTEIQVDNQMATLRKKYL